MPTFRDKTLELVRSGADRPMREAAVLILARETPPEALRTVRGMAEDLNIQKPCVTRALDSLARQGLIVRKPDPEDARSVLVHVTAAGRRVADGLLT